MLATTVLLFVAMREIWKWPLPVVIAIAIGIAAVDAGFLRQYAEDQGGWVPLLLGALICFVMLVWRTHNAGVQK